MSCSIPRSRPRSTRCLRCGSRPSVVPAIRDDRAAMPMPELSDAVERTDHVVRDDPGARRARAPTAGRHDAAAVRVLDPRRRVHPRLLHCRTTRASTCGRRGCRASACRSSTDSRPRRRIPGPLDDCYDGLRWVHEHHDELGIDPGRIGIAGISAGGGLAAALALLARDRARGPRSRSSSSSARCSTTASRRRRAGATASRCGAASRTSSGGAATWASCTAATTCPRYAAPARADDLTNLPPTLVIVGGADGFRDEDIEYAVRLMQSGVPTELHVLPGVPHGVQLAAASSAARRWRDAGRRAGSRVSCAG